MTNGVSTAIAPSWRLAVSRVAALLFNRYTFFLLGVYAYSLVVNLAGGLGAGVGGGAHPDVDALVTDVGLSGNAQH